LVNLTVLLRHDWYPSDFQASSDVSIPPVDSLLHRDFTLLRKLGFPSSGVYRLTVTAEHEFYLWAPDKEDFLPGSDAPRVSLVIAIV